MNFCAECGYKIEGDYRYCPNCGTEIKVSSDSFKDTEIGKDDFTICKNCGEENSIENVICFSCGVPLKRGKKIKSSSSSKVKISSQEKLNNMSYSRDDNLKTREKVLDNKKMLFIISSVIGIVVIALFLSGVYKSDSENTPVQENDQSANSGVSLERLNEITTLENKIKSNPNDFESILHLAHLLQDSRIYEKAIVNYKIYLEKHPENADARVDMGICYYNLGDNMTAIDEMEKSLKYQPKHQIAHLNLGIVNLTAKNIDVAKDLFKKTLELDPSSEAGKRAQELLTSH